MRQDDTRSPNIFPTYSRGEWNRIDINRRVSVSNIVRVQQYTTFNTLKPLKKTNTNKDMIEIIEEEETGLRQESANKQKQKRRHKKQDKSCVKMFAGNCSSVSEKSERIHHK